MTQQKRIACNAGDTGDMGLILGPGSSLGGRNGNPSILDREVLWTEDLGGLQSLRSQKSLTELSN